MKILELLGEYQRSFNTIRKGFIIDDTEQLGKENKKQSDEQSNS